MLRLKPRVYVGQDLSSRGGKKEPREREKAPGESLEASAPGGWVLIIHPWNKSEREREHERSPGCWSNIVRRSNEEIKLRKYATPRGSVSVSLSLSLLFLFCESQMRDMETHFEFPTTSFPVLRFLRDDFKWKKGKRFFFTLPASLGGYKRDWERERERDSVLLYIPSYWLQRSRWWIAYILLYALCAASPFSISR